MGIALAYAGSGNSDATKILENQFQDFEYGFEISAFISLAFGLINIGSCDEDIMGDMISILMARVSENSKLIESPFLILYVLGMGLICMGLQKDAAMIIEMTQLTDFPEDLRLYMKTLISACAYAGSGNVLIIQDFVELISKPKDQINPKVQILAVIGISLISLGEEIGQEMVYRAFDHFLQYGDTNVKQAVSLGLALTKYFIYLVFLIQRFTL